MIKNIIKSVIAVMLIVAFTFSITACSKKPDKDEAKEIVNSLVLGSYELNRIYFGKGLLPKETGNPNEAYSPVSESEPLALKSKLTERTKEIYSLAYAQSLIDMAFKGISTDVTNNVVFARYTVQGDDDWIYVHREIKPIIERLESYDLSKTEIKKLSKKFIEATIYTTGGKAVEITLIKEDGNWRLDTPTY